MQEQVTFLGHIVEHGTLGMEESKVEAVQKWEPMGQNRTKVQVPEFLGFCNYYRHFINHYSDIAKPLTSLTGNVHYQWVPEQDKAFYTLQRAVTTAPLLKQFNRGLPTRLETDASLQAVVVVLEQQHGYAWHPVEYYSSTLTQPQRNWPIHDK